MRGRALLVMRSGHHDGLMVREGGLWRRLVLRQDQ